MMSYKPDEGFRVWPLIMMICCIPLFHYIFTFLFYVGVSCSLGEWANTIGAHDPKSFLGGIPHGISLILMMASFAMGIGDLAGIQDAKNGVVPLCLCAGSCLRLSPF